MNDQIDSRFRNYEEAREFAKGLKIKSSMRWYSYVHGYMPSLPKLPSDIPRDPRNVYRGKGWTTWGDFLGTGNVRLGSIKYRSFEEARAFIRGFGFNTWAEWLMYAGGLMAKPMPRDIPKSPEHVYKNSGWKGGNDWIGKVKI